jgi:hypothetical protein
MKCGNIVQIVSTKTKVASKLEKWKGKNVCMCCQNLKFEIQNATIKLDA